jgi:hypothetical protein
VPLCAQTLVPLTLHVHTRIVLHPHARARSRYLSHKLRAHGLSEYTHPCTDFIDHHHHARISFLIAAMRTSCTHTDSVSTHHQPPSCMHACPSSSLQDPWHRAADGIRCWVSMVVRARLCVVVPSRQGSSPVCSTLRECETCVTFISLNHGLAPLPPPPHVFIDTRSHLTTVAQLLISTRT